MRAQLDDAHAAADRLVREAQRQAEEAADTSAPRVPPRGWDSGRGDAVDVPDLQALLALLDACATRCPRSSRASSPRRCASCCSPCAR